MLPSLLSVCCLGPRSLSERGEGIARDVCRLPSAALRTGVFGSVVPASLPQSGIVLDICTRLFRSERGLVRLNELLRPAARSRGVPGGAVPPCLESGCCLLSRLLSHRELEELQLQLQKQGQRLRRNIRHPNYKPVTPLKGLQLLQRPEVGRVTLSEESSLVGRRWPRTLWTGCAGKRQAYFCSQVGLTERLPVVPVQSVLRDKPVSELRFVSAQVAQCGLLHVFLVVRFPSEKLFSVPDQAPKG